MGINQLDLYEAAKILGIKNPHTVLATGRPLARLLMMHVKKIALKRSKHQERIDTKRLIAGDID